MIKDNKLEDFVPQTRVNETLILSENLGDNLFNSILKKDYKFSATDFKHLANQLDFFHSKNMVHRDIKLENLFFDNEKKRIRISDLDGCGKIGDFKKPLSPGEHLSSTVRLFTTKCQRNTLFQNNSTLSVKFDQFCWLYTMLEAYNGKLFYNDLQMVAALKTGEFVPFLNECIKSEQIDNVKNFLLDPINYSIENLSHVLK